MNRLHKAGMLVATALILSATNCPNSQAQLDDFQVKGIVVNYGIAQRCIAIASGPPNTSGSGSGPLQVLGPFAIYEIRSIANTGSQAATFLFDTDHLRFQAADGRRYTASFSGPLTPVTIAPGTVWDEGGRVIMKYVGPASDLRLRYARGPTEPPVVMTLVPPSVPPEREACPYTELLNLPGI